MSGGQNRLIEHIQKLEFVDVDYEFKHDLYSQVERCHQNCEEYVKVTPDVELVHGWLKVRRTFGEVHYLLHSCIIEKGVLKDITPWKSKSQKIGFSVDQTIQIDQSISHEFVFYNELMNPLPHLIKE